MAELTKAGKPLPADRLEAPNMPGPGYAVMMQGNMVVHQAKGLTEPGERISMVNGYHPTNPLTPDYTQYAQLLFVDPTATITAEYSRHVALQMARLLSGPQGVPGMLQGNFGASRQTNASMFKVQGHFAIPSFPTHPPHPTNPVQIALVLTQRPSSL